MLLTATSHHEPGTDLGYLLHNHPERSTTMSLPFGVAHVECPHVDTRRATCARMAVGQVGHDLGVLALEAEPVDPRL